MKLHGSLKNHNFSEVVYKNVTSNLLPLFKANYEKFLPRLSHHSNPLLSYQYSISIPENPPRRLKRRWYCDLLDHAL